MAKKIFFSVIFSFLLFSFFAEAQNSGKADSLKSYQLSEIVITATKTAVPAYEVASSISLIDSTEIANSHAVNIYDLLQTQYGVSISQQGAPGSFTQVYLRGADPSQTQVLIDGVDMNMTNDPTNTYDFADLSTDNISRIEILRGPQSTLYGSNALAGVINIITKKGTGKPQLFLSTEGGSYNTYKGILGSEGSYKSLNYSITLSKYKSGGFSSAGKKYGNTERDGTDNYTASSRLGYRAAKNFNINFYARFTKANTDLDQFGGKFGDDPTYKYHLEEGAYRTEGILSLLSGKWDQKFGISFLRNLRKYNFDETPNNPYFSNSNYAGNRTKLDWQNNFHLENNLVTIGAETENETASSVYYYDSHTIKGSAFLSAFPEKSARTTAVYLEDQLKLNGSFFTAIGIRYDKHDRFGSVVTYKIAPAYIFWSTGTKIKATFGTGFQAPSLFYLYDPAYGNPNLNPERSKGWDAGVEQYLIGYRLRIGVNYFNNLFTDLFGFDSNFKTVNIKKSETRGVEFYLSAKANNNLSLRANYTFTDSKDLSAGSADENLPLLRRPKHKASLNIDYNISEALNINSDIIFVGQRDDKDFSTYPAKRVKLNSYTLINFSASYRVTGFLQLYGRAVNILNSDYEEVLGYGTAGRSGYLGLRLTFQ